MAIRNPLVIISGVLTEIPITDSAFFASMSLRGTIAAPTTGQGMELNGGSTPLIKAYDRTGAVYLPIGYDATTHTFNSSGTGVMSVKNTGFGYVTGNGGAVTQLTSKATTVVLSKLCGTITLNAAALAAATTVSFTWTNTLLASTDYIVMKHDAVGTLGAYTIVPTAGTGNASIAIRNVHTASLSEAIMLRFFILKAVVT